MKPRREGSMDQAFTSTLCFKLFVKLVCVSVALAFVGAAASSRSYADGLGDILGISPHKDWKTIETEHFRVSFPSELVEIAKKSANYLEQAHTLLAPMLKHAPRTRTQVLILDNIDSANGMASPFQRFGIVLLSTPPESWFSIGDYDDWLRMVAIHEYAHILNMDPTNGIYEPLRYIFGDVFLPNSLWPTWMLEGLAVYIETLTTSAGRGRSSYYEAFLRSGVETGSLDTPDFVTLDKMGGRNPYHPTGETQYLFGYQLMNHVERKHADALGEMSIRSSRRIPFFLNGNLENITGKDWYTFWDEWVSETKARVSADIARLKAAGLTPTQPISDDGSDNSSLGHAASPDGNLIAYNLSGPDHTSGLYLKDLRSGEAKRVGRKILGVGMAFTPDSRHLIFSSLTRQNVHEAWSDLEILNVETLRRHRLTEALRAKDPDVSSDGQWVVFTKAELGAVHLFKAKLMASEGSYALGDPVQLTRAPELGRISNPKFSPDGQTITFSMHSNRKNSEEIYEISASGGDPKIRVKNGAYNRFPFYGQNGDLYFVSDQTGVSNLYRLQTGSQKSELITNVTTALYLPTVSKGGVFYGSRLTDRGWKLESFVPKATPIDPSSVQVSKPPAPPQSKESIALANQPAPDLTVEDYSIWPSILPRQWAPLLLVYQDAAVVGGQVFGFDATDRYRYLLGIAYDSDLKRADWITWLSTRALGPTISAQGIQQNYRTSRSTIMKESDYEFSISYPFEWTISSLTPELAYRIERTSDKFDLGPFQNTFTIMDTSITAKLSYSDLESSQLAVTAESGRAISAGVRNYNIADTHSNKGALSYSEFLELFSHTVLNPRVQGVVSERRVGPKRYGFFSNSNVRVTGRNKNIFAIGGSDPLDKITVRGYPGMEYDTQSAVRTAIDLDLPIAQVFRGWGTNPFFLENVAGFVFAETTYFPQDQPPGTASLPGFGGGVRLTSEIFVRVPLVTTVQYHRGLARAAGGRGEFFFTLGLGSLGF